VRNPRRRVAPLIRLIELESFSARDRVFVVAPHPDDESIATGGVLQAAAAAGAARRVLLVTDGDNNPWPQRWIERRWAIGAGGRARWGARRREEALAALAVLGMAREDVQCLGLPDLGLTAQLMADASDLVERLRGELDAFRPTRLFLPDAGDRHPDHNALHVLLRLALARSAAPAPRLYAFGVHGAGADPAARVVLTLTPAQRDTKRRAIERHATQMALSRRRFVGYAREQEPFVAVAPVPVPDPRHPLQCRIAADGSLIVRIERSRAPHRDDTLFVVLDGGESLLRASVRLADLSERVRVRVKDEAATFTREGTNLVRMDAAIRAGSGWIKLGDASPGLFVLDRHGWQPIVPG
jgi:LmbE family N-acetylglucosaminyl deacetylase